MTYRERIQSLQSEIAAIHYSCHAVIDHATDDEKTGWYGTRHYLQHAHNQLSKLDNSLPEQRAQMEVK